jgi:hypothetical protein
MHCPKKSLDSHASAPVASLAFEPPFATVGEVLQSTLSKVTKPTTPRTTQ